MTIPTRAVSLTAQARIPAPSSRIGQQDGSPQRSQPLMRKYEVTHLSSNQTIENMSQIAPALPIFETAFAAFARGTLLASPMGPIAIEDLLPGDLLTTRDDGSLPVQWIGKVKMVPEWQGQSPEMGKMIRVSADSFGLGRPMPDLLLGSHAYLLQSGAQVQERIGKPQALVSATDLVDWENVISVTPPTPTDLFHIAFDRHAIVTANGLEMESYHPGYAFHNGLSGGMRGLYLSLFPQLELVSDFGPFLYPRLEREQVSAA
ncbi:Hint domain-containing protein [Algirhabdus cladophorae]|uniref:Hint domain-containing protein n=1 Tax=Algirhabdus cladophorae TaxID=3377108 RepID=UPI003B849327